MEKLRALRTLIWPNNQVDETYTLLVSPIHSLTLPDAARARAGIPTSGSFYAFCHSPATSEVEKNAASVIPGLDLSDPMVAWLISGAYIYFDFKYDAVAVNAISFSAEGGSTALYLGPACELPSKAIEPLFDHQRWQRVPGLAATHYGFSSMAWITPSEFLGDTIFTKSGGLAFLHEDDYKGYDHGGDGRIDEVQTTGAGKSRFFPIVRNDPLVEHPTIRSRRADGSTTPLTIARARIDDWPLRDALEAVRNFAYIKPIFKPMRYDAPLYINELSRKQVALAKGVAAFAGLNAAKFIEPPMTMTAATAIFAEGKNAALGLVNALGYDDVTDLLEKVCDKFGITDGHVQVVAKQRGCTHADARWLEAIRKETEQLVAHGTQGDIANFSLEALHRDGAIWLESKEPGAQRAEREKLLEDIFAHLRYILDEEAKEETVRGNDGGSACRDRGHNRMTLADFVRMPQATEAELSHSEVAGLRIYTSLIFRVINGPLRRCTKPHPLSATTYLISNALKKLRANHMKGDKTKFRATYLWRGMRDMTVDQKFLLHGGTELACMSTSSDLRVVADYASSSTPLLFRIQVDSPMELGAEVSWVSLYPGESEWLYPPLSFIKPMFVQEVKGVPGSKVVTVKPSFPS